MLPTVTSAQEVPQPAPVAEKAQANSEMLSSDTLRVIFRGLREVPLSDSSDQNKLVALFEVAEALAYEANSRYASPAKKAGEIIAVDMLRDLPGQPNSIVENIAQMKEGEEAIVLMSTLFLFANAEKKSGYIIQPCTRMERKLAPTQQGIAPTAAAPAAGAPALPKASNAIDMSRPSRSMPSGFSFSIGSGGGGNVQSMRTTSHYDPVTGKNVTRMYINGEEVDPVTRKPLKKP